MTRITKKAGDLRLKQRTGFLVSLILGLALLLYVRASAMDGETGGSAEEKMEAFLDKHGRYGMIPGEAGQSEGKIGLSKIQVVMIGLENMKLKDIPQTGWEVLEGVVAVRVTGNFRIDEGIYSVSEKEEEALNRMLSLMKQMPNLRCLILAEIKLKKVSGEVFMIEQVCGIILCGVRCSEIVVPTGHVPDHIQMMVLFNCSCSDDGNFKQLKSMIPEVMIIPEPKKNHTSSEDSLSGCTEASSMEA
jgi:hypothetical protein